MNFQIYKYKKVYKYANIQVNICGHATGLKKIVKRIDWINEFSNLQIQKVYKYVNL